MARWAVGKRVERTFVPLERIAPVLSRSVIASEDGRFCAHHGVDLGELRAACEDADDISEVRGGSTITQQVAKNLFLWPGRSFIRKGLEFPLALWIDLVLPKRRILEIYLNIAEWGPNGEFGVEAGCALRLQQAGRASCRRARRRCWPRCCPIPSAAAPRRRGRACGGSPRVVQARAARSGADRRVPGPPKRGLALPGGFLYKPGFPKVLTVRRVSRRCF